MKRLERIAGRRLLKILLPRAKELLAEKKLSWQPMSGLGRAQAPYLRIDNVDAVIIYQAPKGGWHGDVVLRSVPPGVPDTLGSPVENPCPTRESAVELVTGLLAQIMGGDAAAMEAGPPVFLFHGFEFSLMPELLEIAPAHTSVERALIRLAEIERTLFPNGVPDGEIALEGEPLARLVSVIYMAAKTGVFRYPPKFDAEPGEGPFVSVH